MSMTEQNKMPDVIEIRELSTHWNNRAKPFMVQITDKGCWRIVSHAPNSSGYVQLERGGKVEPAHRVSYRTFIGGIPEGLRVLHKCDVRDCINPKHLFLGTNSDNSRDMTSKGRQARGQKNGRAKLTKNQVLEIRANERLTRKELANKYGVSQSNIDYILTGQSWKHLLDGESE